ncbi:MAG: hypothetical protein ACPG5P_07780, partial [Saprospiraceae bacterium]
MKQIFFLFFCVLITTGLQAQITPQDTIIVTGQVTGSNGQVYPNAMVEIEWWHNNYFDYAQVSTNSNGIYEYSIPSNSTPEYGINASFHCLLDTNFIVSDYLLQNELVAGFNYIDLETYSCTDSITQDTCFMTLSSQMGASDFLWTFTADPGNIDISGYYDWYLPQGVEFVNPSQSNSSEVDLIFDNGGSYEVSVYLRD